MNIKTQEFELESQDIEVQVLLMAIHSKYGYDFRDYSFVHIKRRLIYLLSITNTGSISMLQHKLLYSRAFFEEQLLPAFSVNVTEMFRDPEFFETLRNEVIPLLKELPFIKVWHCGCSTGEEVYSMAIVLMELGLYNKTQIYATDFNEKVLVNAREGRLPLDDVKLHTKNYQMSGGLKSFSDYYTVVDHDAILNKDLLSNIVFATHNIVSDGVFGEMNVIMCRNVLIYFNKGLQKRSIKIFTDSLTQGGFLCLGSKESIKEKNNLLDVFMEKEKIFIKR